MRRIVITLSLFFIAISCSYAQALYQMANNTVSDCEGILTDSGDGDLAGHYDHNENYTFTICVEGASFITMNFADFCLEEDYDSIRFFDGADTLAPQIGSSYTGTDAPDPIVTTTGCLTVNFVSDANVTCTGWTAFWEAEIEEPVLPEMVAADANPTCSTEVMIFSFDEPLHCDSLLLGNFYIDGPIFNNATSVTPINCVGDSTQSVEVTFSPGLDESGFYEIVYENTFVDECGNVWNISTQDTVYVNDCPLFVEVDASSYTICEGECVDLEAYPSGGDPLTYVFQWSNGLPNNVGPHTVCPVVTTTYYVTLSDASAAPPVTDSVTVTVLPQPSLVPIQTFCQTDPITTLLPIPPPIEPGYWVGPGIVDSALGTFDPALAGIDSIHTLTFVDTFGCSNTMNVQVEPIDAGPDQGACPGAAPFLLTNGTPGGGTWSGPFVQPSGLFNPSTIGVYTLTYTVGNCSDTMDVYVDNVSISPIDTVCRSDPSFWIPATPPGGTWSGPGINGAGEFDPDDVGGGNYTLTYTPLGGCSASIDIYVKEIYIGTNFSACPAQPIDTLQTPIPTGGIWTGIGIIDDSLGIFDASTQGGNYIDTLRYTVNGCTAQRICYVRYTNIGADTVEFCRYDSAFVLNWQSVQRSPWGGVWSGTGIIDPSPSGVFDPVVAGPGMHTLTYEMNTCSDSLIMFVYPIPALTDTSVCELSGDFPLNTSIPGGEWDGTGIIDDSLGIFDPQTTGVGIFDVGYLSPYGCWDTTQIEVFSLPALSIDNLSTEYCYKDTTYNLLATPTGGTFTGPGVVNNTFNPVLAGPGQHILTYRFGSGNCEQSVLGLTIVTPPLEVAVAFPRDTICFGEYITIGAQASGGATAAYTYTWDNGAGSGNSRPVNPTQTTTYTVTASDGCSEVATDQVTIVVFPEFSATFRTSPIRCFGEMGYAVVEVNGIGSYTYEWDTDPPQYTDSINAPSFYDYDVTITEVESGCSITENVEIESYPYVHASFSSNPNDECVNTFDPTFSFLDLSAGASSGYLSFGDGDTIPYAYGFSPSHTYPDTGTFVVSLYVTNDNGCEDTASIEVCVVPEKSTFYVPNAFTPNGDNANDKFIVQGVGVEDYTIEIFDRWGLLVYESDDMTDGWDGRYPNGNFAPEGVYVYVIRGKIFSNDPRINYKQNTLFDKGTITLIR